MGSVSVAGVCRDPAVGAVSPERPTPHAFFNDAARTYVHTHPIPSPTPSPLVISSSQLAVPVPVPAVESLSRVYACTPDVRTDVRAVLTDTLEWTTVLCCMRCMLLSRFSPPF